MVVNKNPNQNTDPEQNNDLFGATGDELGGLESALKPKYELGNLADSLDATEGEENHEAETRSANQREAQGGHSAEIQRRAISIPKGTVIQKGKTSVTISSQMEAQAIPYNNGSGQYYLVKPGTDLTNISSDQWIGNISQSALDALGTVKPSGNQTEEKPKWIGPKGETATEGELKVWDKRQRKNKTITFGLPDNQNATVTPSLFPADNSNPAPKPKQTEPNPGEVSERPQEWQGGERIELQEQAFENNAEQQKVLTQYPFLDPEKQHALIEKFRNVTIDFKDVKDYPRYFGNADIDLQNRGYVTHIVVQSDSVLKRLMDDKSVRRKLETLYGEGKHFVVVIPREYESFEPFKYEVYARPEQKHTTIHNTSVRINQPELVNGTFGSYSDTSKKNTGKKYRQIGCVLPTSGIECRSARPELYYSLIARHDDEQYIPDSVEYSYTAIEIVAGTKGNKRWDELSDGTRLYFEAHEDGDVFKLHLSRYDDLTPQQEIGLSTLAEHRNRLMLWEAGKPLDSTERLHQVTDSANGIWSWPDKQDHPNPEYKVHSDCLTLTYPVINAIRTKVKEGGKYTPEFIALYKKLTKTRSNPSTAKLDRLNSRLRQIEAHNQAYFDALGCSAEDLIPPDKAYDSRRKALIPGSERPNTPVVPTQFTKIEPKPEPVPSKIEPAPDDTDFIGPTPQIDTNGIVTQTGRLSQLFLGNTNPDQGEMVLITKDNQHFQIDYWDASADFPAGYGIEKNLRAPEQNLFDDRMLQVGERIIPIGQYNTVTDIVTDGREIEPGLDADGNITKRGHLSQLYGDVSQGELFLRTGGQYYAIGPWTESEIGNAGYGVMENLEYPDGDPRRFIFTEDLLHKILEPGDRVMNREQYQAERKMLTKIPEDQEPKVTEAGDVQNVGKLSKLYDGQPRGPRVLVTRDYNYYLIDHFDASDDLEAGYGVTRDLRDPDNRIIDEQLLTLSIYPGARVFTIDQYKAFREKTIQRETPYVDENGVIQGEEDQNVGRLSQLFNGGQDRGPLLLETRYGRFKIEYFQASTDFPAGYTITKNLSDPDQDLFDDVELFAGDQVTPFSDDFVPDESPLMSESPCEINLLAHKEFLKETEPGVYEVQKTIDQDALVEMLGEGKKFYWKRAQRVKGYPRRTIVQWGEKRRHRGEQRMGYVNFELNTPVDFKKGDTLDFNLKSIAQKALPEKPGTLAKKRHYLPDEMRVMPATQPNLAEIDLPPSVDAIVQKFPGAYRRGAERMAKNLLAKGIEITAQMPLLVSNLATRRMAFYNPFEQKVHTGIPIAPSRVGISNKPKTKCSMLGTSQFGQIRYTGYGKVAGLGGASSNKGVCLERFGLDRIHEYSKQYGRTLSRKVLDSIHNDEVAFGNDNSHWSTAGERTSGRGGGRSTHMHGITNDRMGNQPASGSWGCLGGYQTKNKHSKWGMIEIAQVIVAARAHGHPAFEESMYWSSSWKDPNNSMT